MKKITLKTLTITHFKGIKKLVIDFKHITNIRATNGLGKTSIFDAFLWLLFDKNSDGKSTFQVRPVDKDNNEIPKLETEVEAIFLIDDLEYSAKKVHRQKWETKTGETVATRKGNENAYFFNGVPILQKDYDKKISSIIDEELFKLLTNVMHFNTKLTWQERRAILISMVGDLKNDEVISEMDLLSEDQKAFLLQILNQHKKLDDYAKIVASQKKKLKDELEQIPNRIDEVRRGKIGEGLDFEFIKTNINQKQLELTKIDEQLSDKSKALEQIHTQITDLQTQVFGLKNQNQTRVQAIKNDMQAKTLQLRSDLSALHSEISLLNDKLTRINRNKTTAETEKKGLEDKMGVLRAKWNEKNAETFSFDETQAVCSACKQALPTDDIAGKKEHLEKEFNSDKATALADLNNKGIGYKTQADQLMIEINGYNAQIKEVSTDIENKKASHTTKSNELSLLTTQTDEETTKQLAGDETINTNQEKILQLEGQIETLRNPCADATADQLKLKKQTLGTELDQLKRDLSKEEALKAAEARIQELSKQESEMSQQKATLEKSEFLIDAFGKAKMDLLVNKINRQFEFVTFKMFKTLQNGGVEDTCETLINGVPFPDANTASKVNAGLDIINNLSRIHLTKCPIFIDNRESVIELIESDSQLVNLIASEAHPELSVSY